MRLLIVTLLLSVFILSCESAEQKKSRLQLEDQARMEIESENQRLEEELESENKRVAEEERQAAEIERKAQELYNRYINNSLGQGATPYSSCFGGNKSCTKWGCSEIQVNGPRDSDVLVTIKKENKVVRHTYIRAGNSYTFQLPNGEYQPFFYYGKGWNPEKAMKSENCNELKGGFISEEVFGKDDPQTLDNSVLTYSLILQQSGNFSTRPSSESEAF